MSTITIAHLYPAQMNIYGDVGNLIVLVKRLQWRGYRVEVAPVEPGKPFAFTSADIIFGGGGQDSGQAAICRDLLRRGPDLVAAVCDGMPLLAVCGLYQLLGELFVTESGREMPGIGVFRAVTHGSPTRMIGNVLVHSRFGDLVGFENHSGNTVLQADQAPLGTVVNGWGNNDRREDEGAVTHHAIGTYLHGPVLPKNPALADHLILTALHRRRLTDELQPLDDRLELAAAASAARRPH